MKPPPDSSKIFSLERPEPKLWTLYLLRALFTGPAAVILLPILYARYHTLRYRFDEEGVHMKVGLLFRQEVNVTYARIQDIHLRSGIIQRWLGLADILIQTASGSAAAEMTIEGFSDYEAIRDFLYSRMRGTRETPPPLPHAHPASAAPVASTEAVALLQEIRDELRATREAIATTRKGEPA